MSHAHTKVDWLSKSISTARLAASHCGELADTALDTSTREMATRYCDFWRQITAKREAELRGRKPQTMRVKPQ